MQVLEVHRLLTTLVALKKKKKAEVSSSISPHHHYILTQKTPYNSIAGKGMYKNKPQDKEIGEKKYFQHLK